MTRAYWRLYYGLWACGTVAAVSAAFVTHSFWGLLAFTPCAALAAHHRSTMRGYRMAALSPPGWERNRQDMLRDPVIWEMAEETRAAWENPYTSARLVWASGMTKFFFMIDCRNEYRRRSKKPLEAHDSCAAEAIAMILTGKAKREDYL